jgi:hypothetical protein
MVPLLNMSTGDGVECDDVGAEADDGVGATGVFRLLSDAKCLMYLVLQQNWSNSSWVILPQSSPIGLPISSQ